jgi:hypothetical protein
MPNLDAAALGGEVVPYPFQFGLCLVLMRNAISVASPAQLQVVPIRAA